MRSNSGRPVAGNSERYERIAAFYDWLDLPFEFGWQRRIRPQLFEGLSGRLLDAGVGTGRNFPFYPAGSHVVGIDFSPAMLARAERRTQLSAAASIKLTKMDVTRIDLPDRSFDAAVATFLFCVLPDESQIAALRELGRVVKPGGMIRLLNYVRPGGTVRGAIANLWQPCVARAFGASFNRHTETAIPAAGLLLLESRYVVHDLIKLMVARVPK
jgi:ubiquinone/menaquinone biosynthesis C-methylase UbiE